MHPGNPKQRNLGRHSGKSGAHRIKYLKPREVPGGAAGKRAVSVYYCTSAIKQIDIDSKAATQNHTTYATATNLGHLQSDKGQGHLFSGSLCYHNIFHGSTRVTYVYPLHTQLVATILQLFHSFLHSNFNLLRLLS